LYNKIYNPKYKFYISNYTIRTKDIIFQIIYFRI